MSQEPQWAASSLLLFDDDVDDDQEEVLVEEDGTVTIVAAPDPEPDGNTTYTVVSNIELHVHRDVEDHSEIMALRSLHDSVVTERDDARRTAQLAEEAVRRLRDTYDEELREMRRQHAHELAARDLERDGMREALQQAMQFALAAEERSSSAECS